MENSHRREFVKKMLGLTGSLTLSGWSYAQTLEKVPDIPASHISPEVVAQDEEFWQQIRQAFTTSPNVIYLNNGNVSPQPLVVQEAMHRYTQFSNEGPGYYMRRIVTKGKEFIRSRLAEIIGADPETIALNRNATEGLQTIIFGLPLEKGAEVIIADQDYPSIKHAIYQRQKREGIKVKEVILPVGFTDPQEIVDTYVQAMTSQTRLLLLTHMIHHTGLILPVAKIAQEAQRRGIEVMVDAAHSYAHVPHRVSDLHCDYYGTSLHKWLCAPFGTGMMHIKASKISKIWPLLAAPTEGKPADIRKFEHLGTHNVPAEMAIGHALDFHNQIGIERKFARLNLLKNYWIEQVKEIKGLHLTVPQAHTGAIAHFSIEGQDMITLYNQLFSKYQVYTMRYHLPGRFDGIRVSPHVYTSLQDLDRLATGITELSQQ